MKIKAPLMMVIVCAILSAFALRAHSFTEKVVAEDALVRMPGTQPDQGVILQDPLVKPGECIACHGERPTDSTGQFIVVPGFSWSGSMMAQAARDPIFWATMVVAAQDSIYALGRPNAVDICLRCHFPQGWLEGRSGHVDPQDLNASAMTNSDFDGVHCDVCHRMWDPFFETSFAGTRESSDWTDYWDEAGTRSAAAALLTLDEDRTLTADIKLFNGNDLFAAHQPVFPAFTENGGGQFFISTANGFVKKRAGFADTVSDHSVLYSRYHKSRYFCSACHDVSNPALANLAHTDLAPGDSATVLISENQPAYAYYHVERTFSEFMLSAYAQPGGAPTNPEFQAQGGGTITIAAKCQDCHMWDTVGKGCGEADAPLRPYESSEHPNSGAPFHTLQGGNAWITSILATTDDHFSQYDPINRALLNQGPAALTLDLDQGIDIRDNGDALLAAAQRAQFQLRLAATIQNVDYDPATGDLSFRILNNTGHKLISGYPEGRRMFVNIKAFDAQDALLFEVNPYDYTVGTLRGLDQGKVPSSPALSADQAYVDDLVYESNPKSDILGATNPNELEKTFHFALATDRFKDNRIPPKGFDLAAAPARLSDPVWKGVKDQVASPANYFSDPEYVGGYDDVDLSSVRDIRPTGATFPAGAARVEITLYYQGTSREYVEFLRDEINGTAPAPNFLTLPAGAYVAQSDPFFEGLRAWGDTMWQLWYHNHGLDGSGAAVPGIVPFEMTRAVWPQLAPCLGDINGDLRVNFADLAELQANFFTDCSTLPAGTACVGDINHDGWVNFSDLSLLKEDFFRTDCPEPAQQNALPLGI